MSQIAPPAPADRLALIIEGLCHAVARRGGLAGLAGPFIILIWSRLRRLATRFARHAITSPAPSRPRAPRPARLRQSQPLPLPRRSAWLLRLVPEAAAGAAQLRHFLADPETTALLAAAPQLHRILRPLCHMLGIRAAGIRAASIRPTQAPRAPSSPTPDAAPSQAPPRPAAPQPAAPRAAFAAVTPWPTPPLSPCRAPPALA